jgi:predicted ATPase with chaperone activity
MYYLVNLINGTLYWLQQLDIFNNHMHTLDSEKEVAFVGGGAYLQPGEISLSPNGVLFKDDIEVIQKSQIVTPVLSLKQ